MKTILGCLSLCLLLALPAQADDQARLDALKAEISKLESWLRNAQQESGQLNAALRQSDLEIAELTKQIDAIRTQLAEEQARLKKLRQEQGQLRDLQQQHRQHLAEQIRAAQKMGQQGPLKLLLNQDDPQQAQRMLRYFSYFNSARIERINQILAELARLDNLATLIAASEQQLQRSEKELISSNRQLQQRKQQQQQLLAKLQGEMKTEQQRLQQKETDRKRLEQLLTEVANLLDNSPRQLDARPISSLKGRLPPPLRTAVLQAFGSQRRDGGGRHEGWLLAAREGDYVRAVHHGRVVFADWLRGFGLILILDHGQGYLSLYAHNQALLRDVGSWVNQGDIISSAGRSGGNAEPSLYFEIRHRGRPQDPALWLKR